MTSSLRRKTLACFILIHVATFSGSATELRLKQRADGQRSVARLGDSADQQEDELNPRLADGDGTIAVAALARRESFPPACRESFSAACGELFPAGRISSWPVVKPRTIRELLVVHGLEQEDQSAVIDPSCRHLRRSHP